MEPLHEHERTDNHADVSVSPATSPLEEKRRGASFFWEVLRLGVIALVIVLPFRLYVATPFQVAGASMSPTFETGNYLIVDRISYRLESPARGDVVVFAFPKDPSKFFIKRIIGLPGERVRIQEGTVVLESPAGSEPWVLSEPYVAASEPVSGGTLTFTLGPDEFFVMGDNRIASSDSRVWGPVSRDLIIGEAFLRLVPLSQIGVHPGSYTFTNNRPAL